MLPYNLKDTATNSFYFLLFTSAHISLSFFNFLVENFIQKYLKKDFCCKFSIFNGFSQTSLLW